MSKDSREMAEADPVETFIAEIAAIGARHEGVAFGVEDDDGQIYMTDIKTAPRGQGIGTAFMVEVEALLDRLDLVMELEPEDGQLDTSRLGAWYARHGFEWMDQYRMRRWPKPHPNRS